MRSTLLLLAVLAGAAPAFAAAPPAPTDLPEGAVARFGTLRLLSHYPRQLTFSPDGKALALSSDGAPRLWDLKTGRIVSLRHLEKAPGALLTFAPDGAHVVGTEDGVRVLDPKSGAVRAWLVPSRKGLWPEAAAVSPDGKRAAVAWKEYTGRPGWERSGVTFHELNGPARDVGRALTAEKVGPISFSPDGALLAGAVYTQLLLWDGRNGKFVRAHGAAGVSGSPVNAFRFSPDGKRLALCYGSEVQMRLSAAGGAVPGFTPPALAVNDLRFSADGKTLSGAAVWSGEVVRWSANTGKVQERFKVAEANVVEWYRLFTLSPDGSALAVTTPGGPVRLWDVAARRERPALEQALQPLRDVTFADNETVAALRADGSVAFWSASDGRLLRAAPSPVKLGRYDYARLSARGERLVIRYSEPPQFDVYEVASGKKLGRVGPFEHEAESFALSPNGASFLSAVEGEVRLWNVATQNALRKMKGPRNLGAVVFAPDGRTVAAEDRRSLYLFDAATGEVRRQLAVPREPEGTQGDYRVSFSPNGALVVLSRPGDLLVYSLELGAVIFRDPRGRALRRVSDGRWLAHAAERQGAIYLRDLLALRAPLEARVLRGQTGSINALAFSPDGRRLVSASEDGTALVWNVKAAVEARPSRLDAPAPEESWTKLASTDAVVAGQAMSKLARFPDVAVPLLKARLRPVPAGPSRDRIDRLVASLGDEASAVRAEARRELERVGTLAEAALRAALAKRPALAHARQIEELLKQASPESNVELLRELRAVAVLERAGTPEARRVLAALAAGAPDARLTRAARTALGR